MESPWRDLGRAVVSAFFLKPHLLPGPARSDRFGWPPRFHLLRKARP